MKFCDLTQFYSPLSGGVKRYVHEKIAYIQSETEHEHVLVVPGPKTECVTSERSRIYFIHSPLISRTSHYRALVNLRAIEQILEREKPDLIESGDPYQVAWKAIASGEALRIPVVGFYHSHFPEAYVRSAAKFLGQTAGEAMMDFTRRYVRNLYNSFQATLVPSARLGSVLSEWGVENVRTVNLGVNTTVFSPSPDDTAETRAELELPAARRLLLYVGRLAKEKNTRLLFRAFAALTENAPEDFHLLVIGDGPERSELEDLQARCPNVTWIGYCTDSFDLARYYRAADLFVHPGHRKRLALWPWRARLVELQWSASAAVTWIALFSTTRNPGRRKTPLNRSLARSRPPAPAICLGWARGRRVWPKNAFPGPGCSNVCLPFTRTCP